MSITTQPNEILDMLLNQTAIPLSQRMLLRAVSRRWKAIIEDDLMNDTSLVLRVTAYPLYSRLKRSDLIVRHIPNRNNEELFNLLARVFQSVSRLTIIGFGNALVSLCTTKFGPFGGQLEMLRMVGVFAFTMASTYEAVGETLNALTNLTSLHLNVHGLDPVLSYLGRTLASLKRFHFLDMLCNDSVGSIISASLSPTCTHLGLTYRNSDLSNRIFVNQLASSLTHLHLFRCPHNLDDINDGVEWVSQLSNLTSFSFHFYSPVNFDSELLRHLVPISSRLTELSLWNLSFKYPLESPGFWQQKSPFLTVKRLYMDFSKYFDDIYFFHTLADWFPGLSQLTHATDRNVQEPNSKLLPYTVELLTERTFPLPIWELNNKSTSF